MKSIKMSNFYFMALLFICALAAVASCKSENKSEKLSQNKVTKDTVTNNKLVTIRNEKMDIGDIDIIYIYFDYWIRQGNITFGVDEKTIDIQAKKIFPDSIVSIDDLKMGYIPVKQYINQNALNYLYEYIKSNCNESIYEEDYRNSKTIFQIITIGKSGKTECMYADSSKVNTFFKGMLNWVYNYPDPEELEMVIQNIKPIINE